MYVSFALHLIVHCAYYKILQNANIVLVIEGFAMEFFHWRRVTECSGFDTNICSLVCAVFCSDTDMLIIQIVMTGSRAEIFI
jgi:hypothetical protein